MGNETSKVSDEWISVHFFHPVEFIEDLKVDGEKEVICGVCEDPALGACYKCSVCNFLCHQPCANVPEEIEHPLHPNHTLKLQLLSSYNSCDACGKSCKTYPIYGCEECEFNIHIRCSSRWRVKKVDCDQHTFIPFQKEIQFTCESCGVEGKHIGLICNKCQLLTHTRCALFSRAIKIVGHEHFLTLTYSIQEVKEQAHIVCEACFEKVNPKYAAYYCQHCGFVVHLRCASDRLIEEVKDATNDLSSTNINQLFSEGYLLGSIRDMNQAVNEIDQPKNIQHFSHPHDLILNNEKVSNDKVCDTCM